MDTITNQENKILKKLQENKNEWINGQFFLRDMYISQYHRALFNLQNKRDKYKYAGVIEASEFKDNYGFKSYRLVGDSEQIKLF